ncbi:protein translocase subunit SecF [Pasteurella canis]|uniref:Protein-export membrane protein SecF n=1 Tax=Pasteurella canis TaxID=753 RepID=A0A379ESS4_9PAST|nr:protein translocase subunit SecF [Pasteurella canis]MXN88641.1 protein translocase subunit SecF [Pasteurella canis]UAX42522.1 protein translocase subunit SecF [Pasteurella canis]UAY78026.1 protein translocase subunit SecF [Pasteurella canis]SPY33531.1 preprotein translocase subunit SecF [Pasteurella canis]SUC09233.1 preprotein translocase subunit SecF [Pasteurella canis]
MSLFTNKKETSEVGNIKLPYRLIRFMDFRKWGYLVSVLVMAASLFFIVTKGFNWGLDFTGGTVIDMSFSQPADLDKVRVTLEQNGIQGAIVQSSGSIRDIIIRLPAAISDANIGNNVKEILAVAVDKNVIVHSIEFVGPNVGEELTQSAIYATLATLLMLLVYIGMRFEWRLAVGAVASLTHDVIVTLGFFSLLQIEVNLTFVAAILTVVGYSLNDSIVVFDRVRENMRKIRRTDVIDIINISLSQTLSRTLMTSVTTVIVVVSLILFGGPSIHSFSVALLIGIAFGTYSSIFVAIALAYDLGLKREHMLPPKIDNDDLDDMP